MGRGHHSVRAFALRRAHRRRGTRHPHRWVADERLQSELEAFTAGRTTFPTQREFNAAGRADLRSAIAELGGIAYWAERLGLALRSRQDRTPYLESDALREAAEIIAPYGRLPGVRTLRALGHTKLASTVQAAGGPVRFAELHHLTQLPPV